jgi:hypothetical protein
MTSENWISVIEEASVQMMYMQKPVRLYLQTAKRVNIYARLGSRASLQLLILGSVNPPIPEKWSSRELQAEYELMMTEWRMIERVMADTILTVSMSDADLTFQVDNVSSVPTEMALAEMDDIEANCRARASPVPCSVLRTFGLQRVLMQKVAKEVVLQGLNYDVASNRERMRNPTALFDQSMLGSIHGKAPKIRRTTGYCILPQIKDVQDAYHPFKANLGLVAAGDTSSETLLELDKAQWAAGIDPVFATITSALESYQRGSGTCTQVGNKQASRQQLEAAVRKVGFLRRLTQKLARQYFFIVKESLPT